MYPRFFEAPNQSFFLFGPRGTGKSTWLKNKYPDAYWIDLLDPKLFRFFSANPEKLVSILKAHPDQKIVVIDEIQKVPDLLNVVHSLIEKKMGYQFILTGSSSRKLKKEGTNLLAGRALLRYMAPFFAKEIQNVFNLQKQLQIGMLPIVIDSKTPEEVLQSYAAIYLKEEVQAEGIVRNVGDFARFLEVMGFSHASLLNTSNIARECQIARRTVDSYLSILQDLLLSFHLEVFRRKAKRSLISHPKFYFFDAGVYYSLRPQALYDIQNDNEGAALEGLVAQHIRNWILAQNTSYHLNFWRTKTKVEVDFIVSGPNCFLALEVKNGTAIHPKDTSGLEIFLDDYPEAKAIILYRGHQKYFEKNVLCYSVEEFLLQVDPKKSLMDIFST